MRRHPGWAAAAAACAINNHALRGEQATAVRDVARRQTGDCERAAWRSLGIGCALSSDVSGRPPATGVGTAVASAVVSSVLSGGCRMSRWALTFVHTCVVNLLVARRFAFCRAQDTHAR